MKYYYLIAAILMFGCKSNEKCNCAHAKMFTIHLTDSLPKVDSIKFDGESLRVFYTPQTYKLTDSFNKK